MVALGGVRRENNWERVWKLPGVMEIFFILRRAWDAQVYSFVSVQQMYIKDVHIYHKQMLNLVNDMHANV